MYVIIPVHHSANITNVYNIAKYLKLHSLLTLRNLHKHQQNTAYPPCNGVPVVGRLISFTTRDGYQALATPAFQHAFRRQQHTTRVRDDSTPGANVNSEPSRRRPWDCRADEIVLAWHRDGSHYDEISAHLLSQGYDATNAIVSASLHRQIDGLERVGSPWDHHADDIVLFAFRCGQRVPQIAATLHRNGYQASVALVAASLNRQGINV